MTDPSPTETVTVAVNREGRPMIPHQTGDGMLKRVIKLEDEVDTLIAHLRAVVANGKADPAWTGWIHALEMLIPDSQPRRLELAEKLRAKGMHGLAERLEFFAKGGDSWTDNQRQREDEPG